MHDALIMAGTAMVGGLLIDLQRRLSLQQAIFAGMALVSLGWIMLLGTVKSGPFPSSTGVAIGCGLLLTGIALLLPALTRSAREARRGKA